MHRPGQADQPHVRAAGATALPPAAPGTEDHVETDISKGRIVHRAIWVAPADGIYVLGATQVFGLYYIDDAPLNLNVKYA